MKTKLKQRSFLTQSEKKLFEKKEKKPSKIFLLIFLLLLLLLGILIGISFAKYQSKVTGQGFASIAKPVLEIKKEQSLLLTAFAPKASYVFEVRNYKEDELNQVDMEYYIEIISNTDESIQFALYQGNKQIPLTQNKTATIKLGKDQKQTHSYRLEITYDNTKGTLGKDINENVEVKIHSIQTANNI